MFDEAVATNPTHLHRLPFSVNDKTGRVATPFGSVSEMPTCLEDMPLASDPHLRSKLQPAYRVLQNALQSLQDDTPQQFLPSLNDRILPVTNAPWMNAARQTRTQGADRQACRVAAAPLRIDIEAAVEWQQKLELGAQAGSLGELSENVGSIARAAESKGKDWRARLRFEAGKVSTLVDAVRTKGGLLDGETHTKGFCRTQTYYPQLGSSQFFQMLSSQTKYEVIAGEYIHVDLKSAHLALSWSAVQLKHGGRAKEVCPNLHLAATNGEEARNKVIQFYANHLVTKRICSPKEAKVKILAAWNDARSDCRFLRDLARERPLAMEALREHPFVAGDVLRAVQQHVADHKKDEMSLLMQTVVSGLVCLERTYSATTTPLSCPHCPSTTHIGKRNHSYHIGGTDSRWSGDRRNRCGRSLCSTNPPVARGKNRSESHT